jgi:hypothetical protein
VRRAVTVGLSTLVLTLLTVGPAWADDPLGPSEGAEPGPGISRLTLVLLYVLLPLAVVSLIAAVVWLPGAMKANRYRPNKPWTATPVWFAGPPSPVEAVQHAEVGDMVRGGARGSW